MRLASRPDPDRVGSGELLLFLPATPPRVAPHHDPPPARRTHQVRVTTILGKFEPFLTGSFCAGAGPRSPDLAAAALPSPLLSPGPRVPVDRRAFREKLNDVICHSSCVAIELVLVARAAAARCPRGAQLRVFGADCTQTAR